MIGDVQIRWLRDAARVAITERSEYQAAQARTVQTRRERAFAAERLDRAARDAAWAWAWSLSRPQCSLERAAIEDEGVAAGDLLEGHPSGQPRLPRPGTA